MSLEHISPEDRVNYYTEQLLALHAQGQRLQGDSVARVLGAIKSLATSIPKTGQGAVKPPSDPKLNVRLTIEDVAQNLLIAAQSPIARIHFDLRDKLQKNLSGSITLGSRGEASGLTALPPVVTRAGSTPDASSPDTSKPDTSKPEDRYGPYLLSLLPAFNRQGSQLYPLESVADDLRSSFENDRTLYDKLPIFLATGHPTAISARRIFLQRLRLECAPAGNRQQLLKDLSSMTFSQFIVSSFGKILGLLAPLHMWSEELREAFKSGDANAKVNALEKFLSTLK